ncbi:hypothetical protein [Nonomuraea rubra]|uniref:Uncharacterized protein n=1 Tax=Nonomuraea rubra TaxID=46180 RepID=A0A7X0U353_9ACTN|nr:hypothetical protein [Nonomuraea rubra]MBB6553547.1 hypothetical protein [Nonomuraea rubra]
MADIHELLVAMDLRGDLSETELAELRRHLGLGSRPEHITEETIVVNEVLDLLPAAGRSTPTGMPRWPS